MEREFKLFLREKKYVKNVLQYTVEFYQYSINAPGKYSSIKNITGINKVNPIDFIAAMRERGMSDSCVTLVSEASIPLKLASSE